jgi:hypothetical protein
MKKFAKRALGALLAIVAVLQLTNPARTNPPVLPGHDLLASNAPPAEIATTLRNACYDCHSHEARWPWYSRVAPVSWFVVHDVNDARRRLNFSDWPNDDPRRAARKLRSMADAISSGEMPLSTYASMHEAARLSVAQREQLAKWATDVADRLQPSSPDKPQP